MIELIPAIDLIDGKCVRLSQGDYASRKEYSASPVEVARRLEISEDELMAFHDMPECTEHFKSQEITYNLGIRLYELLGLEKRIRR